jgi:Bacterial Ig-like domain (group 3)
LRELSRFTIFARALNFVDSKERFEAKYMPGSRPQFTSSNGLHALGPADFGVIYNVQPIYSAGIFGTNVTIAVVARSNINLTDIQEFRQVFGLTGNDPQVVLNGPDPGDLGDGEEVEAVLDASWSGAIAQNANVRFVVSASTNTTDGVTLSEIFIIDNDLGDVMTESFGGCEFGIGTAEEAAILTLAQQAAAQGITYMVSSGDSGAEGCDNPNEETSATGPVSVNVLASTPYTVAVGGTQFNENGHDSTYWNPTNSSNLASVKSYIPEDVWNESCATQCGASGPGIFASSGGASSLVAKPSWQSVVAGIPADKARDLPDVSLNAAGHDPYLICIQGSCGGAGGSISFAGIAGTSASAPSFASVMALVKEKTGSRQGQANYVLYRLAAQETYSGCNGSSTTAALSPSCIFNDVTVGNNAVPGEVGFGTSGAKFQSGVAYDLATGLGSVNVANLVNGWANARSSASTVSLAINPSTGVIHGSPVNVTVGVAPQTGTTTPGGDVSVIAHVVTTIGIGDQPIENMALSSGSASLTTNRFPGGSYNVTAHYEGDGTFTPGDSVPVSINISPETSNMTVTADTGTPPLLTPVTSAVYGSPIVLQAIVTGASGVGTATGQISFTDTNATTIPPAALDKSGTATSAAVSSFAVGSHSITAMYSGDPSFLSSKAAAQFTVTQAPTTSMVQQSIPFLATTPQFVGVVVNASGMGNAPTGTVILFNGNTPIGDPQNLVQNITVSIPQSSASFLITLPPGAATLTAKYNGDSNYLASTAPPLVVNALWSADMIVTSSNPSAQQGSNVTFTATLTPVQPNAPPVTGTVQFSSNSVGSVLCSVPVSNNQAQCTTSALPVGSVTVVGTYSGDTNYVPNHFILGETINPGPDFSVTANPATVTIAKPGQTGSTSLMLSAMNGLTGTFNLVPQCVNLPSESTCAASPASVTFSSTMTTASVMLTVSTTAASSVPASRGVKPTNSRPGTIFVIGLLAFVSLLGLRRGRRGIQVALTVVTFAALLTFAACGGGGGGGGVHDPGTPVGLDPNASVSFTIGNATHAVPISINVQ